LAVITFLAMLGHAPGAHAIAQRTGDFELEIDAPWRMEPRGSDAGYGAIPIQVSIHDADQPASEWDNTLQQLIHLKQGGFKLGDILLTFLAGPVADVLEGFDSVIEWMLGFEVLPFDAFPRVVTLDRFQSLTVSEEIAGQWIPRQVFTLGNIHEVERTIGLWQCHDNPSEPRCAPAPPARPAWSLCRRWAGESCSDYARLRPTSEWNATALYAPATTAPGSDVRLRVDLRVSTIEEDGDSYSRTFQRILSVHLGEAALPRFDSGWIYGDLHYHSQGTDNDGESGYAYRGVLQAMGAMGLDFAFATDHASNSVQIGSAAPTPSDELIRPIPRGLRDLSPDRFAFNLDLLNAPAGANAQVASYPRPGDAPGGLAAPQLFLGGEVDVIPEVIGAGINFCGDLPEMLLMIDQRHPYPDKHWCDSTVSDAGDGRWLVRDVQGPDSGDFLSTRFFARQHLLHLPSDPARHDAFIASNTTKYGGATRRLSDILDGELGQWQKGYAFLAHPFAYASGEGFDRVGPDLVPYSWAQLEEALASPYVLGLQIWNENGLFTASADDRHPFQAPNWTGQHQASRFWDFYGWDNVQLLGLDPARTSQLAWLPAGQPRRVLMAGGSDAHGDFNYRREGAFLGTDGASETALGKPRNLLYVGTPQGQPVQTAAGTARPVSQAQVVNALRSGNFSVTDGPAVRIAIDSNGNGAIDDGDIPMGGVAQLTSEGPFDLIVEWKSSPEFAGVDEIDLYVGVHAEGHLDGIVWTAWRPPGGDPSWHPSDIGGAITYTEPGTERRFTRTPLAPYWFDPTESTLAIDPYPGEEYEGRRAVRIDPAVFPVGEGNCILDPATTFFRWSGQRFAEDLGLAEDGFATADPDLDPEPPATTTTVAELPISPQKRLEDMLNGGVIDPPPPCKAREFQNAERADRMFIRAAVKNHKVPGSVQDCVDAPIRRTECVETVPGLACVEVSVEDTQCVYRRAYTNPVWVTLTPCAIPYLCNLRIYDVADSPSAEPADGSTVGVNPALFDTQLPSLGVLETTRDADSDGISDDSDRCPFFASASPLDSDGNGRGDDCECGDQNGDGTVSVLDLIAVNAAIFRPELATPLCDANGDARCDVSDISAINAEMFSQGSTSTCARQPVAGS
jgi:hypothetical protein